MMYWWEEVEVSDWQTARTWWESLLALLDGSMSTYLQFWQSQPSSPSSLPSTMRRRTNVQSCSQKFWSWSHEEEFCIVEWWRVILIIPTLYTSLKWNLTPYLFLNFLAEQGYRGVYHFKQDTGTSQLIPCMKDTAFRFEPAKTLPCPIR